MTNTNRDLLKRLLHLFPTKNLKEHFSHTGNATDVIEYLTGNRTKAQLVDFALVSHLLTRQNIYIYTLDKAFNRAQMRGNFPIDIEKEVVTLGSYTFFCLPKTTFQVYLSNPQTNQTEKKEIVFYQPVFIKVHGKSLIIHYTKLEKSVASYFDPSFEPKKASAENTEPDTLSDILTFFEQDYTVDVNDINKGVKYLWAIDDVDCHRIQSRNPHSTRIETMDGVMTYKQKYPAEYQKIILTPLGSAQWKYLKADDYFCEGFTADPSAGQISITKFPKLPNQVNNVITKILANN